MQVAGLATTKQPTSQLRLQIESKVFHLSFLFPIFQNVLVNMAQKATNFGRRLVPRVLDELADTDPKRVYAAIPKSADVKDGFHDVTVADLSRCVDFMASWLDEKFGRSESFETITYIGLSDLRGPTTLLGSIKVGYKVWKKTLSMAFADDDSSWFRHRETRLRLPCI